MRQPPMAVASLSSCRWSSTGGCLERGIDHWLAGGSWLMCTLKRWQLAALQLMAAGSEEWPTAADTRVTGNKLLHLAASAAAGLQQLWCYGHWIYIRNLPSRFNVDLLAHCSDYPMYRDFCPYITNHGLGPKTFTGSHKWYRTQPHMLELIFHRQMLEYPCLCRRRLSPLL
ncbi:hypothetical protein MRB53_006388 [Persea americana]|uniref:Uncharacterized protein n=1 Tax=Persea americana TaxID=3435 RepID=A0ACC2MG59_PERAE|nr:hypothetical protein MRB53_006388 [Persea americana]